MFPFLHYFVDKIQPVLVPICFVCTWLFLGALGWSLFSAIRAATQRTQTMHQVPCTGCQFFTGDYRLKCTVHPAIANTEKAINCFDYYPNPNPFVQHQKP